MSTTRNDAARINRSGPSGHSHTIDTAWVTSFVPTLAQGSATNIAKIVQRVRWIRIGELILYQGSLVANGAGVTNQIITVSLPQTADITGVSGYDIVGTSGYMDYSSGTSAVVPGNAVLYHNVTTKLAFLRSDVSAATAYGTNPNIPVEIGDVLSWSVAYQSPI